MKDDIIEIVDIDVLKFVKRLIFIKYKLEHVENEKFITLSIYGFNRDTGDKEIIKINVINSEKYYSYRFSYNRKNWYCSLLRELNTIRRENISTIDDKSFLDSIHYDIASSIRQRCYRTLFNRSDNYNNYSDLVKKYLEIEKKRCSKGGIYDNIIYPKDKNIDIRREYANKNINTFDFIIVSFYVLHFKSKKEVIEFFKENKKELNSIVITAIQNAEKFQKYNIPINFLKLDSIVVTNSLELVYTFSLKELSDFSLKELSESLYSDNNY